MCFECDKYLVIQFVVVVFIFVNECKIIKFLLNDNSKHYSLCSALLSHFIRQKIEKKMCVMSQLLSV